MNARTLIVVAAVLLIGGFAAADAIRGRAAERAVATAERETGPPTTATAPDSTSGPVPRPRPEAPPGWPAGALQGDVVFTNAEDCRIRVIALSGGRERPAAPTLGDCRLWAAPVGQRVAYGLGGGQNDMVPFRFLDLAHPNRELGGYSALFGFLVWSDDAQRAAWCGRKRTGFDLNLGGSSQRLPRCPAAYTPEGEIAYSVGNRLVAAGRTLVRASGGITFADLQEGGRAVVVVDGLRIETWLQGRRTAEVVLPSELEGRTPLVAPDGCAALFRTGAGVELLDLGCYPGEERRTFPALAGAWSPDGKWIAVAEQRTIAFHRVGGAPRTIRWPASAIELAWRP